MNNIFYTAEHTFRITPNLPLHVAEESGRTRCLFRRPFLLLYKEGTVRTTMASMYVRSSVKDSKERMKLLCIFCESFQGVKARSRR